MKAALTFAFALGCAAHGQSINPALRSVSLDAKPIANTHSVRDDFKTDYGSYDKNYARSRVVEVTVRTTKGADIPVVMRTWWLGRPVAQAKRVLLSMDEKKLTLTTQPQSINVTSGLVEGRDFNLKLLGERLTGGFRISGWIVTIHDPDTDALVAYKLSEGGLESLVRPKFAVRDLPKVEQ